MSFPIHDWQFWAVTLLCAAAAAWLGRGLLPRKWRRKKRGKRVTLTVGGKPAR